MTTNLSSSKNSYLNHIYQSLADIELENNNLQRQ
jgi:hypothetical protein